MKRNKQGCDLKSCFLCRLCSKEWLPAVDAHRQSFHVNKGELLFTEGTEVTGIYFIYKGTFKVHKKWTEDKELIVRLARSGAILGHRGLGNDVFYPVSATALEPGEVCFIDIGFFQSTLKVNPQFLYELMMFFAGELKESEKKMRNLAHMPVKGRIAQALLSIQSTFGTSPDGFLDINLSRQDLASYTGTTYETVFRLMNELVQEGSIALSGRNIYITDADKLLTYTVQ
ncbi:transcriptional regulator [Niastella yeongjuensis]|uniref:Transcriptional regulator n=1 Tax=Niastella yeongjuensis TaxID=354355 RepID=A0A1V9EN54_9BACT|nr:Crp/Fnr family transcriptional regulator [Niastella yeongjuensis]OQP47374.1 transcriptional regulator [Niastella yeongjuensis]SEN81101.1 CRP/FNR family transcriptional regulator, anaerobic regulatory protein [Niastella yeongjuensis]